MIGLLFSIDFTAGPVSLIGDPLGFSHGFTGCFYQQLGHDELQAEPLGICIPTHTNIQTDTQSFLFPYPPSVIGVPPGKQH